MCLVTYSSDVQSISVEGEDCAGFSFSQSTEELLMSMTEEYSLMKRCVPLKFHLASGFLKCDYCRATSHCSDWSVYWWFTQFTACESFYICANLQVCLRLRWKGKSQQWTLCVFINYYFNSKCSSSHFYPSDSPCLLASNPWVWS